MSGRAGCHQPRIVIGFPYKVKGRDSNGDDGYDWKPRIRATLLIVMSMIMVRLGSPYKGNAADSDVDDDGRIGIPL